MEGLGDESLAPDMMHAIAKAYIGNYGSFSHSEIPPKKDDQIMVYEGPFRVLLLGRFAEPSDGKIILEYQILRRRVSISLSPISIGRTAVRIPRHIGG